MASYNIIVKPIFTEKVTRQMEKSNGREFTFIVEKEANKIEIKKMIESMYNVNVESVRTCIKVRKRSTRMTKSGILHGKTKVYKKAYIKLQEGETIEFFSSGN